MHLRNSALFFAETQVGVIGVAAIVIATRSFLTGITRGRKFLITSPPSMCVCMYLVHVFQIQPRSAGPLAVRAQNQPLLPRRCTAAPVDVLSSPTYSRSQCEAQFAPTSSLHSSTPAAAVSLSAAHGSPLDPSSSQGPSPQRPPPWMFSVRHIHPLQWGGCR